MKHAVVTPLLRGVGKRTTTAREERGLSMREVALEAGMDPARISRLEKETLIDGITVETLWLVAAALDVDFNWLAFGVGSMSRMSQTERSKKVEVKAYIEGRKRGYIPKPTTPRASPTRSRSGSFPSSRPFPAAKRRTGE